MPFGGLFDEKTESESESRAYPWQYAGPGLRKAAGITGKALKERLRFFPDQTYAGQTEAERQAIEQMLAGAGAYPGLLGGYMDPATGAWQGALGAPGAALGMGLQDVVNNPALASAADAITGRMTENLTENILPQLTQQFMGYGGLGGTRQGLAEAQAVEGTQEAIGDALAGMYGNAWARGLGAETSRYLGGLSAQSGALGKLPGMVGLGLTEYTQPAELLGQAGGLQRTEEQRAIDEARARFEFGQYEPYQRAGLGMDLLMQPAMAFGTSTSKSETTTSPSAFGALGQVLGAGGSILGAGMGGMGALGGAFGGGLGAAGGYGLGPLGYGMGYGINPYGQQANMLAAQWA